MLDLGKRRFRMLSVLFHVYVGGISTLSTILKIGIGTIAGAILIKEIRKANTIYDKFRNKVFKKFEKICFVKPTENIH